MKWVVVTSNKNREMEAPVRSLLSFRTVLRQQRVSHSKVLAKMDWTGGARRRCAQSGKNNEFRAKQKAHAAKARALGATRSPGSTITPDFIREAVSRKVSSTSRRRDSAHNHKRDSVRRSAPASNPRQHHIVASERAEVAHHSASTARDMSDRAIPPHVDGGKKQAALADLTDDQCRLRAIRQRLLARTDWLGLSASKPLRIKFPADRDKERVGKRRKVEKPRHRDVDKQIQRRVTPPFQHRERLIEPMMSGALMNNDITVTIGTDAFASQTQRSRRSPTPINTSLRPPSAELASLSEESMLLHEEDGDFLAGDDMLSLVHYDDDSERHAEVSEQGPVQAERLSSNDQLLATWGSQQWPSMQTSQHDLTNRIRPYAPVAPVLQSVSHALVSEFSPNLIVDTSGRHANDEGLQRPKSDQVPQSSVAHPPSSAICSADTVLAEFDRDDETEWWQQPLNTDTGLADIASAFAFMAPSNRRMHPGPDPETTSALSSRQLSWSPSHHLPPQLHLARPLIDTKRIETAASAQEATKSTQHTQGSSAQTHDSRAMDTEYNDNEKWKHFILGSIESDGASSPCSDRLSTGAKERDELRMPTPNDATSDPPQSDRATIGQATAAADLSTDAATATLADGRTENTSMIGHAAATLPLADDGEGDHLHEGTTRTKSNAYAPIQMLPAARFRRSKRSQPEPLPKADRFLPATSVRAVSHRRSVYDLSSVSN